MIRLLEEQRRQRSREELEESVRLSWFAFWSEEQPCPYYHNSVTNEVAWRLPDGVTVQALQEPARQNEPEVAASSEEWTIEATDRPTTVSSSTRSGDFTRPQAQANRGGTAGESSFPPNMPGNGSGTRANDVTVETTREPGVVESVESRHEVLEGVTRGKDDEYDLQPSENATPEEVMNIWMIGCSEWQGELCASYHNRVTGVAQLERPPEVLERRRDDEYARKLPEAMARTKREREAARSTEEGFAQSAPGSSG